MVGVRRRRLVQKIHHEASLFVPSFRIQACFVRLLEDVCFFDFIHEFRMFKYELFFGYLPMILLMTLERGVSAP